MRPHLFVSCGWRSATAAPYLLSGRCLHVTASGPFTPRTLDPDKTPRPPTYHQPPPDKPILVPSKRRAAAFQWPPPDYLWLVTEAKAFLH
jgi:hypothetical protein